MRILYYLAPLVLVLSASAAEVVFDSGVSYVALTGPKYETDPDPSIASEDESIFSPYFGVRTDFSERFALRIGYQYIGELTTKAVYSSPPGAGPVEPQVVVPARYQSNIHVISFGPQFRTKMRSSLVVFASPDINWVIERGEIVYFSSVPIKRNGERITLGVSAGIRWSMTQRWSLDLTYRYVDASPSWSREAHSFGLGVSFR
jgi:opacity protein-like surface antigen